METCQGVEVFLIKSWKDFRNSSIYTYLGKGSRHVSVSLHLSLSVSLSISINHHLSVAYILYAHIHICNVINVIWRFFLYTQKTISPRIFLYSLNFPFGHILWNLNYLVYI